MIVELTHYNKSLIFISSWEFEDTSWLEVKDKINIFIYNLSKSKDYLFYINETDIPVETVQIILDGSPNKFYSLQSILNDYFSILNAKVLIS